jgi:ribonuclease Y
MEWVAVAATAVIAGVVGIAVGFLVRGVWASQTVKAAQDKAGRIVAEARAQQKDLILEAKDEKLRLQREAEEEARAKRSELGGLERRLLSRDEQLDQRADLLEEKARKINDREREVEHQREELGRLNQERVVALEKVSGLTAEDAKGILLEAIREEAEHDAVKLARSIERRARDEAQDKAREIIVTAMQRVAADHTAEHTVTVVHLPSDEMKGRIIGREGRNIRALEQATGVDLIIDDTPETVVLSGFDPVRREVARVALTKLIADGRIHPGRIEEVVTKARAEVDLIIRQAGEQAVYDAGVPGLPPELVKTLGRLKYRTSYGQNVLLHCVETSHLAAIIAAELGADIQAAKIGGLLHDIGKALDHEIEGPHAAIGAALAQKHNMPFKVVNGIAAHHQEVEYACIEAPIVQVADAISASRPGARGETMETYVKRLEDLQAIAESFTGVERSFAVQAGREVRILVRPEEIDDLSASRLARDIVKKIEDSLTYPGQIKVTVIRETRATEYAK